MRKNRSKLVVALATLTLAVTAFSACATEKKAESKTESGAGESTDMSDAAKGTEAPTGESTGLASPWIEVKDLKEALRETGIELDAPDTIGEFHQSAVQVMKDQGGMVQVFYGGVTDKTETQILLRKGRGEADISGDYTVYPEDRIANEEDFTVRLRGQDGRVYVASWQRGEEAYSLSIAQGMDEIDVMEVISKIK